MKISFRLDQLDSHAHFALYVNGARAGHLCLRADEYREFVWLFEQSIDEYGIEFTLNDNRYKQVEGLRSRNPAAMSELLKKEPHA